MIKLNHYGLHRIAGGVALLVQENGVDHVLGVPLDYDVEVDRKRRCTHRIVLSSAVEPPLPDDALLRAMLPLPRRIEDRPLFIEESEANWRLLQTLARLTSPGDFSVLQPGWMTHVRDLQDTNIQPLVAYGFEMSHIVQLNRLLDAARVSPRRLIVMGPRLLTVGSRADRVEPTITADQVKDLNLEAAGAWVLKQHMLGSH